MARPRRPPQPPVEDNRAGLDRWSGTLDSRVVRRSRKPWIGVPVAACTMALIPGAGAVTTFVGLVRDHNVDRSVLWLDYEAYAPLAEKALALTS